MEGQMGDRTDVVSQVYEAFGAGDGAGLARLLDGIEWHEAAGMPYGGLYHGFPEVAANVFGPINRDVQNFSARPDSVLPAGDDRVLALGRYRGQGAAEAVDVPFAHLWTVADGRLTRFEQFADTHRFRQAVGQ
jgi:ketosteroid isomerase-like protein